VIIAQKIKSERACYHGEQKQKEGANHLRSNIQMQNLVFLSKLNFVFKIYLILFNNKVKFVFQQTNSRKKCKQSWRNFEESLFKYQAFHNDCFPSGVLLGRVVFIAK